MRYLFLFCCCCLLACESQTPPAEQAAVAVTPAPVSDALLMRLSTEMISDPQTLAERQRNEILQYAMDRNLDLQPTASGLWYLITNPGETEKPRLAWGDRIDVDYTGRLLDGKVFDSTEGKDPLNFYIGNMIDGWNEGLQLLHPGASAEFIVPSHLAYGEAGIKTPKGRKLVPENAVLHFSVTVK